MARNFTSHTKCPKSPPHLYYAVRTPSHCKLLTTHQSNQDDAGTTADLSTGSLVLGTLRWTVCDCRSSLIASPQQVYMAAFLQLIPLPEKIQQDIIPVVSLVLISFPALGAYSADRFGSCSSPSGSSYPSAASSSSNSATASSPSTTYPRLTPSLWARSILRKASCG